MPEQETVSFEECINTLNKNKTSYSRKGLDIQIFFVAQLFHTSYDEVLQAMKRA